MSARQGTGWTRPGAPHPLFAHADWADWADWDDTLVHLYSFSRACRRTGHRAGALASSPALLGEIGKNLDTITICPNQIGQQAALWGIANLQGWLADQRADILERRTAFASIDRAGIDEMLTRLAALPF